jgi:hypothetical protein
MKRFTTIIGIVAGIILLGIGIIAQPIFIFLTAADYP